MTAEYRVTLICDWCGDEVDTGQQRFDEARDHASNWENWQTPNRGRDICENCVEDTINGTDSRPEREDFPPLPTREVAKPQRALPRERVRAARAKS